ncbi:translocon-associated protein TRAP gamma subunit [Tieghemostelium lacteum]|uniref:Translocon-associated protein subunit gamma n=1 Tax=Tieghemostelium lacteum TaxID=361077 RepID=A0A151ZEB0_TIELA|nr:translocon-associated protein TRAP gamma subunit [Tieghemostelium lacteum]|eukprot:KYQ92224.1 translocon-associated protein TRAP gamma subunit [Tieghemostelium lacteum]
MKPQVEEDEFSAFRNENVVSVEQKIVYFINGLFVSLIPVYLFHSIYSLTLESYIIVYASVTLFSALVLSFAYNNIYRLKKLKLSTTRDHLLSASKTKVQSGYDKKKVLAAKKESQALVTSHEAIAMSIMYNNALFIVSTLVFSFVIFKSVPLVYNFIASVAMASGVTAFLSTGSKQH